MIQAEDVLAQPPEGLPTELTDVWIGVALTLFILDRVWYMIKSRMNGGEIKKADPEAARQERVSRDNLAAVHRILAGDELTEGLAKGQTRILKALETSNVTQEQLVNRLDKLEDRVGAVEAVLLRERAS